MDFSPEMVGLASRRTAGFDNVVVVRGDAQDLPFADGTLTHIYEYIMNITLDYEYTVIILTPGTTASSPFATPTVSGLIPTNILYDYCTTKYWYATTPL